MIKKPFEIRELSGSLFKNPKQTNEKAPQMTGSCLIGGVEYWVSAWTREGENGRWQSLAFTKKDEKPQAQKDESIPF